MGTQLSSQRLRHTTLGSATGEVQLQFSIPSATGDVVRTLRSVNVRELWDYLMEQWPRYRLARPHHSVTYDSHRGGGSFQANCGKMFLLLSTRQYLDASDDQWEILERLISYQPHLVNRPSNYLQQLNESAPGGMYELNKVMERGRDRVDCIEVLKIFFQISVNVVDIWVSFREPSLWVYRAGLERSITRINRKLEDPLSVISSQAKLHISEINISGVWAFIWNEVRQLIQVQHLHPSELGWRMYDIIVRTATIPSCDPHGLIKRLVESRWGVQPEEVLWFRPDGCKSREIVLYTSHTVLGSRPHEFSLDETEAQFFNLEAELTRRVQLPRRVDTNPFAAQPRADVAMHTFLLQRADRNAQCSICLDSLRSPQKLAVALLCCDHEFRDDCIGDWINSSVPTSNTCPQCRRIICLKE